MEKALKVAAIFNLFSCLRDSKNGNKETKGIQKYSEQKKTKLKSISKNQSKMNQFK